MNKCQKQWRHGFMTGVKRANSFDKGDTVTIIEAEALNKLRHDSLLLSIMRDMGVFNTDSGQYWPGTEQAFTILEDLSP